MTIKEELSKQSDKRKHPQVSSSWLTVGFFSHRWENTPNYKTVALKSPCITRVPRRNTARLQGEKIVYSLLQLKVKFAWEQPDVGSWQEMPLGFQQETPAGCHFHWTAGVVSACLSNMSSYQLARWEIWTSLCIGSQVLRKRAIIFASLSEDRGLGWFLWTLLSSPQKSIN